MTFQPKQAANLSNIAKRGLWLESAALLWSAQGYWVAVPCNQVRRFSVCL